MSKPYAGESTIQALIKNIKASFAAITHRHDDLYYTKNEIDNMEHITVADIDAICGSNIQSASEVMF